METAPGRMKNFLKITSIIFLFLLARISNAQNIEFTKDNFPGKKAELKAALKQFDKGDEYYRTGKPGYNRALDLYLKVYEFNPKNADLNFKIGMCYLNTIKKSNAVTYLEKAFSLDPKVDARIVYFLARAYHLNLQFDEAIENYSKYKNSLTAFQSADELSDLIKKTEECNNGKKLIEFPKRVIIDNLGASINTQYAEHTPVISADETSLLYTSRRDNTTGGKKDPDDDDYYEDIFFSEKKKGIWSPAENIGTTINTSEHDAAVGLSADGQKLFIYKGDNGGDIYECLLKGNEWSKPQKLDATINTINHESSACYTFDERTIYFVSDRPDKTLGGRDIYSSKKNKDGFYEEPVNLGKTVNTKYDEEGVFIHPDGKTLYFSSKGHNTMGGYDIFKTIWDETTRSWSEPENLGYPVNTPDDDVYFVVSASGKHGYFTSVQKEGMGEKDIYMITFLGREKKMLISTEDNLLASVAAPLVEKRVQPEATISSQLTILKGIIFDEKTKIPMEGGIDIVDNEKNEIIATFISNSQTGKYLITLPSGRNYGIAVTASGYLFHSENLNIPASQEYQELTKDIGLKKFEVGSRIVLNNIFFDFNKATLRKESFFELDRLYDVLRNNPSIRVEISGFTDNIGSEDYNQKLSENRSRSVVAYLINKGIPQDHLEYKGYGLNQPIATNETAEGRQMNRRTEFKILGK